MNKPSVLLKLREWFTLDEAAAHLSSVCGEPVSRASVLRLASEKRLKLSVYLVNGTEAKLGVQISPEDAEWKVIPKDLFAMRREDFEKLTEEERKKGLAEGTLRWVCCDARLDGDLFLRFDDKVVHIDGVWDLSMLGGERLDVEHLYQQETGGPEVTGIVLDGVLLERVESDGVVFATPQDVFDPRGKSRDLETTEYVVAQLETGFADGSITNSLEHNPPEKAGRKLHHSKKPFYFPRGGLPEDGVLVVRTSALMEFVSTLAGDEEKPLRTREKGNLLRAIALLAVELEAKRGIDLSTLSKETQTLEKKHTGLVTVVPARTLEEKLKEAMELVGIQRPKKK